MTTEFVSLPKHAMLAAVATMAVTAGAFAALDQPAAVIPDATENLRFRRQ